MKIKNTKTRMMRAALYIVLIVLAFLMLVCGWITLGYGFFSFL